MPNLRPTCTEGTLLLGDLAVAITIQGARGVNLARLCNLDLILGRIIVEWEESLEAFLIAQNYAKEQMEKADTKDKLYWQGVKDGLRKCYAIFTNDPAWNTLGGGSPQERPAGARLRDWPASAT